MGFSERKTFLLSAILLKQCRVPRTLNFTCFRTKDCTSSSERPEVRFSVPYSRLPAQFFSLSPAAQEKRGATAGAAISRDAVLRNRRLFMVRLVAHFSACHGMTEPKEDRYSTSPLVGVRA